MVANGAPGAQLVEALGPQLVEALDLGSGRKTTTTQWLCGRNRRPARRSRNNSALLLAIKSSKGPERPPGRSTQLGKAPPSSPTLGAPRDYARLAVHAAFGSFFVRPPMLLGARRPRCSSDRRRPPAPPGVVQTRADKGRRLHPTADIPPRRPTAATLPDHRHFRDTVLRHHCSLPPTVRGTHDGATTTP